jgi:ribosomal protein L16 Arg81 hydroxylase
MQPSVEATNPVCDYDALTFQSLVAPHEPEAVLKDFWGKKPLLIRGHPDKFRALFSLERLKTCLRVVGDPPPRPLSIRASFDRGANHVQARPMEAMYLYSAGATLCIQNIGLIDACLANTAEAIRRELNFIGPADFRAYLSPPGQGFDTHFDARIATTLQIEGRKRWRFSNEVAIEWPHFQINSAGGTFRSGRPLQNWEKFRVPTDCSFEEAILEPGDLLCLPAGTWHSAEAIDCSLGLNLAFGIPGGLWGVLAPVLTSLLVMNPKWREPPPPTLAPNNSGITALPECIESFLRERLNDLIDLLRSLNDDPEALYQAWARFQQAAPADDSL